MSEYDEAVEAFRQRWGFDPSPAIENAFRRSEFELEGGTEDERAFIREALTTVSGNGMLAVNIVCDDGEEGRCFVEVAAGGSWSYLVPEGVRMAAGKLVHPGDTVSGKIDFSRW